MWENSLLHLLVVIVEPGEGRRLGLIVKALKTELLEIWEIIVTSSQNQQEDDLSTPAVT